MDKNAALIGSPITLAELKGLGEFARWQDIGPRVADLVDSKRLPSGYPLLPCRLPTNGIIDLCVGGRWRQVLLVRTEGSWLSGGRQIIYVDKGTENTAKYDWYGVAPAGYYTKWAGPRPETLAGAELLDGFELAQQGHVIHSQSVVEEDWPYLTFRVKSCDPKAHWVDEENMRDGRYTVHVADPRVKVEGVAPREPWFNTTISVSHRWLSPDHPDPEGEQYRELITLCEKLGLNENQTFLIDYCSLPQKPFTPDEDSWFRANLSGFQSRFKYVTIVLNTGSADYSTRAWCMLELMLASMNRASRPTLLNHDRLDAPLAEARQIAASYVKHSVWNEQKMSKAFHTGLTTATFSKWARDPVNVALYNSRNEGRRAILEKFEHEFELTEPNDRPIVLDLLKKLAFEASDK